MDRKRSDWWLTATSTRTLHHCIKLLEESLLLTQQKNVKSPDGEIVGQRESTSQQRQRQDKAGGISFKKSTVSVASQTSRKRTGSVSSKRTESVSRKRTGSVSRKAVEHVRRFNVPRSRSRRNSFVHRRVRYKKSQSWTTCSEDAWTTRRVRDGHSPPRTVN